MSPHSACIHDVHAALQGSGMIHPNMATMLGVVTCDAAVAADAWRDMVRRASIASFNQITVSGT
jgi:glutamate N-acetyltransferase/amino-acid N-acetyltransferase